RWLFALAIPDVGKTTAQDVAKFHATIDDVAQSPLLRDILDYHETLAGLPGLKREHPERFEQLKQKVLAIAKRLIDAGFAAPSKSKAEKELGIVTKVGP